MATTQLCTFMVDDLLFGVEVSKVQEVLAAQQMTRVPLSSGMVGGLLNLRGQIVTAIDLRACLRFAARRAGEPSMNVVVRDGHSCVSLLVDSIGDVSDVESETFESPPSTVRGVQRQLIHSVCKLPRALLLLLLPERVLALAASATTRPRGLEVVH